MPTYSIIILRGSFIPIVLDIDSSPAVDIVKIVPDFGSISPREISSNPEDSIILAFIVTYSTVALHV